MSGDVVTHACTPAASTNASAALWEADSGAGPDVGVGVGVGTVGGLPQPSVMTTETPTLAMTPRVRERLRISLARTHVRYFSDSFVRVLI